MTDEVVLTDEMTTRKGVECIYTEYLSTWHVFLMLKFMSRLITRKTRTSTNDV